jgi:hypothetical protein
MSTNTERIVPYVADLMPAIGNDTENSFSYNKFLNTIAVKEREGKLPYFVRELKASDTVKDNDGTSSREFRKLKYGKSNYEVSMFSDGISMDAKEWLEKTETEKTQSRLNGAIEMVDMYHWKNEVEFKSMLTGLSNSVINEEVVGAGLDIANNDSLTATYTSYLRNIVDRNNLVAFVPVDVVDVIKTRFKTDAMLLNTFAYDGSETSVKRFVKEILFGNEISGVVIGDIIDANEDGVSANLWSGVKDIYVQHKSLSPSLESQDGINHLYWSYIASPYIFKEHLTEKSNMNQMLPEYKEWMDSTYGFFVKKPKNVLRIKGAIV